MQRTIIGLTTADGHADPLDSVSGGDWAIDVCETMTYLDGDAIQHGYAGTYQTSEQDVPAISGDTVEFETRDVREPVATEFFADLETGYVCVDSSAGAFMFGADGLVRRAAHVDVVRAHLNVPAFAKALTETYDNPTWWQVGWKEEEDGDTLDAGVSYHRGTREHDPTSNNTSQLGFAFRRSNGEYVRGTCAQSGYVEVYEPAWGADAMARWLRDDVLPHCSLPADDSGEQTSFTPTCQECGRESDSVEDGLCIVCQSKNDEEGVV